MENWRYIDFLPFEASHNMAVDEAISISVMNSLSPPTLRLYGWTKPSISIGAFQRIRDINLHLSRQLDIPLVRRPTGGRAILHDEELTYSFSIKTSKGIFTDSLLKNYRIISSAFCYALKKLGIHATMSEGRIKKNMLSDSPLCFQSTSYGEITVHGQKIIGSAQRRFQDGFLQQGSIPLLINRDLVSRLFSSSDSLAGLKEMGTPVTRKSLSTAIREAFEMVFHVRLIPGYLSESEQAMASELVKKYSLEDWTFSR